MAERYTPFIIDSDKDVQSVSFDGIVMTAANFNAEIAKMEAIEAALTPFLLGKIYASNRVANFDQNEDPVVPPTNHQAQKHTQWLLTFKETATGATWTRKVSTADYTKATSQDPFGNFYVDLSDGDIGEDLKTAFDAFITHPETGGASVLIDMRIYEG